MPWIDLENTLVIFPCGLLIFELGLPELANAQVERDHIIVSPIT
jgi:hypothetical protein